MSKTLVLAEKPSVAKDIARVLQCQKKLNGAFEGTRYIVTWALGHLVTLADPEVYDKKYKNWEMDDLPIMPDKMALVVIPKTRHQYQAVKTQMTRKDVSEIVIATDAGREGELVARWILLKSGIKKPLKRLWISSITDKAIRDGFAHLKNAKEYEPLYYSAYARSEADWLVGINATRALTCKYNAQLSCGRVQTPTLAMIASREEEIKNFQPIPFYGLQAKIDHMVWTWYTKKNEVRSFDKLFVQNLYQQIQGQDLLVKDIKKTAKKSYAPLLYDLTELQRDANQLYGFSAKKTLDLMQSLYEYHKVLTYPRTDSRYLTDDVVPTIKDRLKANLGQEYDDLIEQILSHPIRKQTHFVNNSKVSDHHAIIPTEQPAYPETFTEDERKIYQLVLKRFIAVLLPPYEYEETMITASIGKETFITKGRIEKALGYKAIRHLSKEPEDDSLPLPTLKTNTYLKVDHLEITNGTTKPPAYFTEATLLSAMENPLSYMTHASKEMNQTLLNTGGLGTVATRADIIDKLFNTFLIEKRGQEIHVTAKGRQLLNLVPQDLRSPELTARWEMELSRIAKGQEHSKSFTNEIRRYTQTLIEEINNSEAKFKHDNITGKKCPNCGEPLLEVNSKKGKMLVCSNRECHYKETLSLITNARCPNCHKKLELVGPKGKQLFVCKHCGYRQQMSTFKKEREDYKATAGKADVRKYLQQQKKQQQTALEDSPFASLLAMKKDL